MFKEKLNKKLAASMEEYGFTEPTPIQAQCLTKITGGFDVIGIGPDNAGKSSLIVMGTIQKLQRAVEKTPRALILVSSKEKAIAMEEQFNALTKYTDLRVHLLYEGGNIDQQSIDIYDDGSDIVIGTAKRTLEVYFLRNLNLNKIKLFVIDDAEMIIKNFLQGQIDRLALSLPKCQHLVFTNELSPKIEKLIEKFIIAPHIVEVEE